MWAPESNELELPIIEKITDPQLLLAQICDSLQQKDTRSLKTHILEHKIRDDGIFWDLILQIGNCINAETCENTPDFFDVCCRCLVYLVKVGNPKETLLALLEQVDTFIDDVKFKNFLPPIQTALLKIPSKLFHSLDITLETVSSHLRYLKLPDNTQLQGDEIKIFHLDATVVRLTDILLAYLNFLEPFVKSVNTQQGNLTIAVKQEALVLKKHLIRLLEHPLCYLVLTFDPLSDRDKSDSRLCAELAMTLLSKVETDFHRLLKNAATGNEKRPTSEKKHEQHTKAVTDGHVDEENDNLENERRLASGHVAKDGVTDIVESWDFSLEIVPLSRACLAYLIHVEHLGVETFPAVFRHDYILDLHLDVISILLKNINYPINYKGLLLFKALAELVPKSTIVADYLDNPIYMTVVNDLIHIMIKCPLRDHRTLATKIFPILISRFVPAGRYQIYTSVLVTCDHSGLKGYLITLLKNDVDACLRYLLAKGGAEKEGETTKDSEKLLPDYFTGKRLEKLLKLAFGLPEKETTDMLENSDQIISSLNLLRFLILADSALNNRTGFWNFLPAIETDFLSPLQRGLDLSKAHYNLELDSLKGGNKSVTSSEKTEMSVSVAGLSLPMMEEAEKIELLGKAINTHHVMQSLVARVSELIDQHKKAVV